MAGKAIIERDYLYIADKSAEALRIGSQQWYSWLEQNNAFVYRGHGGHFTARCELRRGLPYWYAYRRRNGRLSKTYLGKAEDLTPERLEQASVFLSGQMPIAQFSRQTNVAELIAALESPVSAPDADRQSVLAECRTLNPAKITPPSLPQYLVRRHHLVARINTPLTLVYAPSGFGKTTLLNEWQRFRNIPVAWVSVEIEDNSPAIFWSVIINALQTLGVEIGQSLLPYLVGLSAADLAELVTDLAHEITLYVEAAGQTPALALVLDDYQHIQSAEIHTSLQIFIEHLPAQMMIVLATHTRPPLALGYLRTTGRVTELVTDDLRFSIEEGVDFLTYYCGKHVLAYNDMQALIKHTEGWAAGLMLAALAFSQQQRFRISEAFTGAHSYLQEYFREQVLYRQPPAVQQFLMKTSILKQLSGQLCDALTGQANGSEMLSRLWDENLFVVRLEDAGWYRYHDMFAEMLRSELAVQWPGAVEALHRAAAEWYAQQNAPADAVYHLLAIEAWQEASQVIESVALAEMQHYGEDSRLLRWLQQLPEAVVQQHKTLLAVYIRLARVSLSTGEVQRFLRTVETNIIRKSVAERLPDELEVLAEIHRIQRQWEFDEGGVITLPQGNGYDTMWQLLNEIIRFQHQYRANLDRAVELEYAVYQKARRVNNLYVLLMAGGGCASRILAQGYLRRSEKLSYEVLQQAYNLRGKLPEPASIALITLSRICYERNQLEEAHRLLLRVAEVDPNPTSTNMPLNIAVHRAMLQMTAGDFTAAHTTLQAARDLNTKRPSRIWLDDDLLGYQALVAVRQGDIHLAGQLISEVETRETHGLIGLVRAEILVAQGQYAAAVAQLETLLQRYPYGFYHEPLIAVRVLLAVALAGEGQIYQARCAMATAVRMAGPEGHIRPFLDYVPQCIPLLNVILDTEKLALGTQIMVRRILKVSSNRDTDENQVDYQRDMAVLSTAASISVREKEVLQLVAAGMSNRAVAHALSVAESTIKSHLKNIYAKLDVHNRTQAVAYAQALKIIQPDIPSDI